MKRSVLVLCAVFVLCIAPPVIGHEFWIDAKNYQLERGDWLRANLRLGVDYRGAALSFLPPEFEKLTMIDSEGERPVKGRLGDLPAVKVRAKNDGLHIIVFQSKPQFLDYKTLAKFERFVTREGVQWAIAAHKTRGLPESNFRERYTRFAKALIKVGDGAGRDRAVGMPLELVVLSNPYLSDPGEDILVQLLWRGDPLASAQVSIYRKNVGEAAERSTVRTDASGQARVPRGAGGRFLLNAVHLVEPAGKVPKSTVWHSLWASTTYELPEAGR